MAYLLVRWRTINKLEQHPKSKESFEPVKGISLLCLALPNNPKKVETFLLDKPVVLNEGVWHNIMTLSSESEVKIAENYMVGANHYKLAAEVTPMMIYPS